MVTTHIFEMGDMGSILGQATALRVFKIIEEKVLPSLTKIPHEHVPKSHVITHVITRVHMSSHVILEHVHVEFF